MLDDSDDDDWPDGGYSCSREGRQVEQQRESMAQVELRDESVRCGRQAAVRRRVECAENNTDVAINVQMEVCSCMSS